MPTPLALTKIGKSISHFHTRYATAFSLRGSWMVTRNLINIILVLPLPFGHSPTAFLLGWCWTSELNSDLPPAGRVGRYLPVRPTLLVSYTRKARSLAGRHDAIAFIGSLVKNSRIGKSTYPRSRDSASLSRVHTARVPGTQRQGPSCYAIVANSLNKLFTY